MAFQFDGLKIYIYFHSGVEIIYFNEVKEINSRNSTFFYALFFSSSLSFVSTFLVWLHIHTFYIQLTKWKTLTIASIFAIIFLYVFVCVCVFFISCLLACFVLCMSPMHRSKWASYFDYTYWNCNMIINSTQSLLWKIACAHTSLLAVGERIRVYTYKCSFIWLGFLLSFFRSCPPSTKIFFFSAKKHFFRSNNTSIDCSMDRVAM